MRLHFGLAMDECRSLSETLPDLRRDWLVAYMYGDERTCWNGMVSRIRLVLALVAVVNRFVCVGDLGDVRG
jgi:hypothetical protein